MDHLGTHQEGPHLEDRRNQKRQTIEFVEVVWVLRSWVAAEVSHSRQKEMSFAVAEVGKGRTVAIEGMQALTELWKERLPEKQLTFVLVR